MTSYVRAPYTLNAHQRPMVGDTKMGFTNFDHMGWLVCDGRTLNKAEFEMLFNVIGYTFGGSGATFKLPDFTGRVAGMPGRPAPVNGSSPDTYVKGDISGTQYHTLTIPEMPAHNHGVAGGGQGPLNNLTGISGEHTHDINDPEHAHSITDIGHTHTSKFPGSQGVAALGGSNDVAEDQLGSAYDVNTSNQPTGITIDANATGITIVPNGDHAHVLNPAGGDQPHTNMQPTLFYGNMFVYCGRVNYGCEGLQGQSFVGFPFFPTNNGLL
jgi:microcystin-dependent protein